MVLGITVNTDAVTRIEDKSSQKLEPFSIDNLVVGDYVEVRGGEFPAGSGEILARLVERDDLEAKTELRGFVTVETATTLEVLGVTISTSAGTEYRDEAEAPISETEFFDRVTVGSLISVSGTETGERVIDAEELELEN